MRGSPADKAGIKLGDIILYCNGKLLEDSGQFKILVSEARPGTTARLSIFRKGDVIELNVTFV